MDITGYNYFIAQFLTPFVNKYYGELPETLKDLQRAAWKDKSLSGTYKMWIDELISLYGWYAKVSVIFPGTYVKAQTK